MKYTLLELKFEDGKFNYSEQKDGLERLKETPNIKGMPNIAFVYCPTGKESEWKKKLFQYVEDRVNMQIKKSKECLKALEVARKSRSKRA